MIKRNCLFCPAQDEGVERQAFFIGADVVQIAVGTYEQPVSLPDCYLIALDPVFQDAGLFLSRRSREHRQHLHVAIHHGAFVGHLYAVPLEKRQGHADSHIHGVRSHAEHGKKHPGVLDAADAAAFVCPEDIVVGMGRHVVPLVERELFRAEAVAWSKNQLKPGAGKGQLPVGALGP